MELKDFISASLEGIARNDCNISMDDIAAALNHKPIQYTRGSEPI